MDDFNKWQANEILRTLMGRKLGFGGSRQVYACAVDPTLVIKVETASQSFSNVMEWTYWNELISPYDAMRPLFAPCVAISPCGSVLVQKRTERARVFPEWVPAAWTDLKLANFGMLDDRLVCHDYAFVVTDRLGPKLVMKRAEWWDEDDYRNNPLHNRDATEAKSSCAPNTRKLESH